MIINVIFAMNVRVFRIWNSIYKICGKNRVWKRFGERFDHDVERFSNLQSGQVSTVDAALSLELITEAAARLTPLATDLLDVGCGAGNYTLKMLSKRPGLHCTLLDLSRPMLDRAVERVSACSAGRVTAVQRDVREADLANAGTISCCREPRCIICAGTRSG